MKYLARLFSFLLGTINYKPAQWMSSLYLFCHTKRFLRIWLPGILVIMLAGGYGFYWYSHRPIPSYVSVTVVNPAATSLEPNAKPQPATINFSKSVFLPQYFDKNISDQIEVTPQLKGDWHVSAADRLTVTPEKNWDVGRTYSIRFNKSLFDRKTLLKDPTYTLTTAPLAIAVTSFKIEEDLINPLKRTGLAVLSLSHQVDRSSFEKRLRLALVVNDPSSGKRTENVLAPSVTYSDKGDAAFVRSPELAIPAVDGKLSIDIAPGVTALLPGTETKNPVQFSTKVPGAENYFKVKNIEVRAIDNPKSFSAERIISVSTSSLTSSNELERHVEAYLLPKPQKHVEEADTDTSVAADDQPDGTDDGSYGEEGAEGEEGADAAENDEPTDSTDSQVIENSKIQNLETCPVKTAAEVTDAMLARAQKVSLKRISEDKPYIDSMSFSFQSEKNRCVFVRVNAGAKSAAGVLLAKTFNSLHAVSPFPGFVDFVHKGSILTIAGDKKLTFYGRNVRGASLKLFRILPDSIHHLVSQSYGSFSAPSFNYNFGPENISEVFSSSIHFAPVEDGAPSFSTFDFTNYIQNNKIPRGLFLLRIGSDYQNNGGTFTEVNRVVLFTDIGFLVKTNLDHSRVVLVSSLQSSAPMAGATVELLGKNGQAVFSGTADATGRVDVPIVDAFQFEKEPLVWVVKNGADISFMPYARRDRDVNLSRYDVGGINALDGSAKDLSAFVFTDRGIYRPGETAHLHSIVKRLDWAPLVDKLPLVVTIDDPRGKTIISEQLYAHPEGFNDYDFSVNDSALTGTYHWSINRKDKYGLTPLGEGTFKVEEFEPDRIKIESHLSEAIDDSTLWITPGDVNVISQVKNLFGTPSVDANVSASLQLRPSIPVVKGFPGYSFVNPYADSKSFDEDLGEVRTDETGSGTFALGLSRFEKALYRLVVVTEAQEKNSGRKVYTQIRTMVNPLSRLFGFKGNGNLQFVRKGGAAAVDIIAVNNKGKKDEASGLVARLYRKEITSVLAKTESGSYAYQTQEKKVVVFENAVTIPKEGLTLPLGGYDVGSYVYELSTTDGVKALEFQFGVVGDAGQVNRTPRVSEIKLTTEKNDFKGGEDIAIAMQAPYPGSGFITIEKDKVYAHAFFKCETLDCIKHITMPESLEGNGYITVTYVRAVDSDDIFTNPFSAATLPISVNQERRTLQTSLVVPDMVKPGATLEIKASSIRPSKAVIYGVDEGILQVARYKKPDPFSVFYAKRALEVSTSQILDLLLPEYEIERRLSAAGGDDDAMLGKIKNPFKRKGQKPVVYYSGIVDLTPEVKTFQMPIPDYFNGSVKVYVVAVDSQSVGVREGTVTVQGDVVVQPSMPVVAAPGDTFQISTIVNNLHIDKASIGLSLETNEKLEVLDKTPQVKQIGKGHDDVFSSKIRATNVLGEGTVNVIARNGAEIVAKYPLSISIRPSAPLRTVIENKKIESGQTTVQLAGQNYPYEAKRLVRFSKTPAVFLEGLSQYLDSYPYGCSEQLLSQIAAKLVAPTTSVSSKFIKNALSLLAGRSQGEGGIALWDGENADRETTFHEAYVFTELEKRAFSIPKGQKENLQQFLTNSVNLNPSNESEALDSAKSIYYETLFGDATSEQALSLKENLSSDKKFEGWKKSRTALYLASALEALKMEDEAKKLVTQIVPPKNVTEVRPAVSGFGDYLSVLAEYQLLLKRHFPALYNKYATEMQNNISTEIVAKRYSTYSAARLLLAADVGNDLSSEEVKSIKITDSNNQVAPWNEAERGFIVPPGASSITVNSGQPMYLSSFDTGYPVVAPSPSENGIAITREILTKDGKPVTTYRLGDEYIVQLSFRSIATPIYQGVITDLLPAGFEIITGSLETTIVGSVESIITAFLPSFYQFRDDRAVFFGPIPNDMKRIRYHVRAVSIGTFAPPVTVAESMYAFDTFGVAKQESDHIEIAE